MVKYYAADMPRGASFTLEHYRDPATRAVCFIMVDACEPGRHSLTYDIEAAVDEITAYITARQGEGLGRLGTWPIVCRVTAGAWKGVLPPYYRCNGTAWKLGRGTPFYPLNVPGQLPPDTAELAACRALEMWQQGRGPFNPEE